MSNNKNCQISSERIDDVVLLLNVMKQIGLPEIINRHLPRHGNEKGLNWGWVALIWLSYILSVGDHRKVKVREWVNQRSYTIETVCDLELRETDFTDDRLGILLKRLSHDSSSSEIETDLNRNSIRVYQLGVKQIRIDATTNSGYHLVTEEGLFQFGHSKDNPNLPQIKTMMASLDPLGMPLVTKVVSGEKADDELYVPALKQIFSTLDSPGLLCVGDCKMSAINTRGSIHGENHYYLCPLSKVGQVPQLLSESIELALRGKLQSIKIIRHSDDGQEQVLGTGYELEREQETTINGLTQTWTERVLLVRSCSYFKKQQRGLQTRLETARQKLLALTPPVGRGKRQIRDELELCQKAEQILKTHRVEGLLDYDYEYEVPTNHQPGRYQITAVTPETTAIQQVEQQLGWRVYVTNAPESRLSLTQAVLTYRDEWIVERSFHRLKGCPLSISPFFVQRDDQIKGLVHLLSLAVRILTLIEFVVRRSLQESGNLLLGLYPGNPKKATQRPTAEKLLAAFKHLTLTLFRVKGEWYGDVTELNPLQNQILLCLGLSRDIYSGLVENST
jgi:transposase